MIASAASQAAFSFSTVKPGARAATCDPGDVERIVERVRAEVHQPLQLAVIVIETGVENGDARGRGAQMAGGPRGVGADHLYRKLGWHAVGAIPAYALDTDGLTPHDAVSRLDVGEQLRPGHGHRRRRDPATSCRRRSRIP